MADEDGRIRAVVAWFVRRWEDLSGTPREAVAQLGESLRAHLESKRRILSERKDRELSASELDQEFREMSRELRQRVRR